MKEIIGVRFRPNGKIYVECGQFVIVETARGVEFGKVVLGKRNIDDGKIVSTLKTIIRVATDEDKKKNEDNKEKSKKAFVICKEKIAKHKLDMKLIEAEYTFDNNKILFYFTITYLSFISIIINMNFNKYSYFIIFHSIIIY